MRIGQKQEEKTPSPLENGPKKATVEPSLRTPVRYLKGVGPERSRLLARLGLETIEDLFYFFPRRYENRFPVKTVSELTCGDDKECVAGRISSRSVIRTRSGTLFKMVVTDGKKALYATWFNQPYLKDVFLPGARVVLYGQAEPTGRNAQMIHPEYELESASSRVHTGRITPIYPLTEDLGQRSLRHLFYAVLRDLGRLVREPLAEDLRRRLGFPDRLKALREIHFPPDEAAFKEAYQRLVFDEFFMLQLFVQAKRARLRTENKLLSHVTGQNEVQRFVEGLAFSLTAGQKRTIDEILADMKKNVPMNRLVQGDVGSGKTAVAAAALVFTVSNGFQGALMAPTEVLAQQHFYNLSQLLEPLGISCGYLAQGIGEAKKKEVLARTTDGSIQVLIGTHALLAEEVRFAKLGLAIVDEQHKFGVVQRGSLRQKSKYPTHFLLLTATPIPRTLAMTLYGDLDVSVMAELPKGRRPVKTFWVGKDKRAEVYRMLDRLLEEGKQAYVICPLIDRRATASAKSALETHHELSAFFPHRRIGLLHGRMKPDEKKRVMSDFKERRIDALVSTVVIEVGIDVPNASLMIVENAERFGLAQLHQLRGRVGRGSDESVCVLFSDAQDPESTERLSAFEETESGFEIAEKDLELRGAGDLAGRSQHGLAKLRIGDLTKDFELLSRAKEEAARILNEDPNLARPEHRELKKGVRSRFVDSAEPERAD